MAESRTGPGRRERNVMIVIRAEARRAGKVVASPEAGGHGEARARPRTRCLRHRRCASSPRLSPRRSMPGSPLTPRGLPVRIPPRQPTPPPWCRHQRRRHAGPVSARTLRRWTAKRWTCRQAGCTDHPSRLRNGGSRLVIHRRRPSLPAGYGGAEALRPGEPTGGGRHRRGRRRSCRRWPGPGARRRPRPRARRRVGG